MDKARYKVPHPKDSILLSSRTFIPVSCYRWKLPGHIEALPVNYPPNIHSTQFRANEPLTMLKVLPFCNLLLAVGVILCGALPNLNIRESFTAIRRSWLPRSIPSILAEGEVAGVNCNSNAPTYLWLPSDDYSGSSISSE